MKRRHKELIIAFFTFIGGIYFFLEFMLPGFLAGFLSDDSLVLLRRALLPKRLEDYALNQIHDAISRGVQVVGVMAIGLGIINILRVHGGRVLKTSKGWFNSLALLLGLFAVISIQAADVVTLDRMENRRRNLDSLALYAQRVLKDYREQEIEPGPRLNALERALTKLERTYDLPSEGKNEEFLGSLARLRSALLASEVSLQSLSQVYGTAENRDLPALDAATEDLGRTLKDAARAVQELSQIEYREALSTKADHFVFEAFFTPLGSAMFSLLAFYIASAAYRSLRIRSLEALVMMIPAIIVMLGQIPHGPLYISPHLPAIRGWMLENLSTPAFRAITFGALIAGLAMAVRMWLSLEKSPLAGDDVVTDSKGKTQ